VRGFHCGNSVHVYSVTWTNSLSPLYPHFSLLPPLSNSVQWGSLYSVLQFVSKDMLILKPQLCYLILHNPIILFFAFICLFLVNQVILVFLSIPQYNFLVIYVLKRNYSRCTISTLHFSQSIRFLCAGSFLGIPC
jgi:hypothetical protein